MNISAILFGAALGALPFITAIFGRWIADKQLKSRIAEATKDLPPK